LISYTPDRPDRDGSFHRVEVRAKRPGLAVRHRKEFQDLDEKERVALALAAAHDFPAQTSSYILPSLVQYLRRSDGDYTVTIRVGVPYREIEPDRGTAGVNDDIHFSFLVRDQEGQVRFNDHPIVGLRSSLAEFSELRRREAALEYVQNYKLPPGTYTVGVATLDAARGATAGAALLVRLPAAGEACLSLSPPLLAGGVLAADPPAPAPAWNERGEVLYKDKRLVFSVEPVLPQSGSLSGLYQLYNARAQAESRSPSVFLSFRLYRGETERISATDERELLAFTDPEAQLITNFFTVPYKALAPGNYELEIAARDAHSGCTAASRAGFRIAPPASPPPAAPGSR
jgi:hypothetical protein